MYSLKKLLIAVPIFLALSAPALSGCVGPTPPPGVTEGRAQVRALHLAAAVPDVDIFVDRGDEPAFAGLSFTDSTEYAELDADQHQLDVSIAGTSADESVLSANPRLMSTATYTAIAYGTEDGADLMLVRDETGDRPSDQIRVRLIHLASSVPAVDVYNMPRDGEPTAVAYDLEFESSTEPLDLPPGSHIFGLDVDRDGEADLRFELPDLSPGIYINLFATQDADGTAFLLAQLPGGVTARIDAAAVSGPSAGNAHVRVLHASPDAPPVDVFVDDAADPAIANLPFTWGSPFNELPEGAYRFRVSATGTTADAAVIDAAGVALADGGSYTVVALGELSAISPLVLTEDYSPLEPNTIRLRAIHAADGVAQVDIYALDSTGAASLAYADVDFGEAGAPIDVPAGDYSFGIDADDDGLIDAIFDTAPFVAGTVANLFALTDAEGSLFLLTQLRDGNTRRVDPSTDERSTGAIRVLHLSPDAPDVDVFLNGAGTPAIAGLSFEGGTELVDLPASSYAIDVSASGASAADSVISVPSFGVEAGVSSTIVAFDTLSAIRPLVLTEDFSAPTAGSIRVRAVHTAVGVGEVDILNVPEHGIPSIVIDDLDFGEAADALELPAGTYRLGLDLDDDRVPEATFLLPALASQTIVNVFAVSDDTSVFLLAQLANGTTLRVDSSHL